MKRLVSFRKLKISSGFMFLKRFLSCLSDSVSVNLSKPVTVYESVFDCQGYLVSCTYCKEGFCPLEGVSG